MKRITLSMVIFFGLFLALCTEAAARPHRSSAVDPGCNVIMPCEGVTPSARGQRVVLAQRGFGTARQIYTPFSRTYAGGSVGGRPRAWCGWWMQVHTGITSAATKLNLNMAREWARVGSSAGGPQVGAIVVWRHHVGKITGQTSSGQWIVKSGNDGNAVRERPRSVAGAIAFRNV